MPSNVVFTCIPCRFSAKQTSTCPHCRGPMIYMGKAFKPPRKTNDSQWRKVEMLVDHDVRFGYCSCHRPRRKIFKSLSDAKDFVGKRRSDKKDYADNPSVSDKQAKKRIAWKGRDW